MFNKKCTCLLPVRVISVISKYVHHYSSCSTCIICGNNQNGFMNGNQQDVTPSELMPLWPFAKVCRNFEKNYVVVMIKNMSQKYSSLEPPPESTDLPFNPIRSQDPGTIFLRHTFEKRCKVTCTIIMLVLCPKCNVEEIDDARNKRKRRKKCADEENMTTRRRKLLPPMSYDEGCRKALHDSSNISIHAASMVKCHYKNEISYSIISSADGRGLMKKLIIGSLTINTLITCSSDIRKTQEVNVGPQVNLSLSQFTSKNTRVFLQTKEVEHLKKAFEQSPSSYQFQSVSSLRQLSSSFDHISTYRPYRATLYDFDDTPFMPATVFTLCDTPNNDGYGSLHKSCAKLGSLLLQKVAIALNTKTGLDHASLDDFFTIYGTASKTEDAASRKLLDNIVDDIKEKYEKTNNQDINVKSFISQANLSKLANLVGSSLSKENEKIKANVTERILNLYK